MELFPHAGFLPVAQAPRSRSNPIRSHLLWEHLPGDAALQDEDDASQGGSVVNAGLPPLGFGGSSANRDSTFCQSSSDTSSLLMTTSVTSTHKQVLRDSLNRVSRKFILSAVSLSAPNPISCQSTHITHPLSEEHHILM
jgi:hypothetical protein